MTPSRLIRAVLIADQPLFRIGLACALHEDPAIAIVGDAAHATAALPLIARTYPTVVVLATPLYGLTAMALTRLIRRQAPEAAVLLLLPNPTPAGCESALAAGASQCASITSPPAAIARLVRELGLAGAPPRLPAARRSMAADPSACPLTDRDLMVLDALVHGLDSAAIAHQLDLSESRLKNVLATLMRNLGVHTRTAALMVAIQRGWIGWGARAPSA